MDETKTQPKESEPFALTPTDLREIADMVEGVEKLNLNLVNETKIYLVLDGVVFWVLLGYDLGSVFGMLAYGAEDDD